MRIEDMLESIEKILRYTRGLTFDGFVTNDLVLDAVVRNLSILGEAAVHVPQAIVVQYPELPWMEMRGMRNVIVHEYFGADAVTIWDTIQNDLPPLVDQLKKILADQE